MKLAFLDLTPRLPRIHLSMTAISLIIAAGCGQRQSATPQVTATTKDNQWFWDEVTKATQLESNANVIFTVEGARADHAVRLRRPSLTITNDLVHVSDFQSVLASVQGRELAVVEMHANGFDTNRLTNAAAQLRRCGFQSIRAIVLGWGGRFPGPEL